MNRNLVNGYFEKNLGDDLFLKILTERYPNEIFEIHSRWNYKNIINSNNLIVKSNFNIINICLKIYNKLNKKKVLNYSNFINYKNEITIGGSVFIENKNVNVKQKVKNKSRKFILGSNFGPYYSDEYLKNYEKEFLEYEDICFRDEYSWKLFKNLENVRKASDIVFSLDISNIKITSRRRVIISVINCKKDSMNLDSSVYIDKIIELIKFFEKKKYEVLLMSFSQVQGDEHVIDEIKSKYNSENIESYFYRGNINEALNILGDSEIIVGTRFHANILGMLMGKTVIPIAYSNKTVNILEDMNYKGLYFNLNNIKDFEINRITEDCLNYKQDISHEKIESEKQFLGLDKVFSRGKEK